MLLPGFFGIHFPFDLVELIEKQDFQGALQCGGQFQCICQRRIPLTRFPAV
jgi:hypothetical protein